jgi:hypothetical protein
VNEAICSDLAETENPTYLGQLLNRARGVTFVRRLVGVNGTIFPVLFEIDIITERSFKRRLSAIWRKNDAHVGKFVPNPPFVTFNVCESRVRLSFE